MPRGPCCHQGFYRRRDTSARQVPHPAPTPQHKANRVKADTKGRLTLPSARDGLLNTYSSWKTMANAGWLTISGRRKRLLKTRAWFPELVGDTSQEVLEHGLPSHLGPLTTVSSRSPGTPGHRESALLGLRCSLSLPLAATLVLQRQPAGEQSSHCEQPATEAWEGPSQH